MTDDSEASLRYAAVGVRNQPPRPGPFAQVWSAVTAPVLASRVVFPRRFDAAVARRAAAGIPPAHALWYFGAALRLWIDPRLLRSRLSDFVFDGQRPRWIGSSFLDGGDWSAALADVDKSPVHREMVELVAADLDFRKTGSYRQFLKRARQGRPYARNGIVLARRDQVDAYFRYCADLARSVRADGLVPRREFGRYGTGRAQHAAARPRMLDFAERDIGVAISETGTFVRHLGGKHRTAVALALQLPRIPVEVRLVHTGWLQDEMRRTGLPAHKALPDALSRLQERWQPAQADAGR